MSREEYAEVFPRALAGARARFGNPIRKETARHLAEKMLRLNRPQRRLFITGSHLTTSIFVSQALTALAFERSRQQPREGLAAARVAVEVAYLVPGYRPNHEMVWDLRAAALGKLANALRLVEKYAEARRVWKRAEACQERGSADPLLAADLANARSLLARDERRFGQAEILLTEAKGWNARAGDSLGQARTHILLGYLRFYTQDYQASLSETLTGAELLLGEGNEEALMGAFHNLALAAAESGAIRSALWIMAQNAGRYQKHASPSFQLRLQWTLGKMAHELCDFLGAGSAFDAVRREYIRQQLPYDASLASLDLALVYLKLGQHAKVRQLAEEMLGVFRAKQIPREASAALLLFVEAARREAATVDTVSRLVVDLKTRLAPPGKSQPVGKFIS